MNPLLPIRSTCQSAGETGSFTASALIVMAGRSENSIAVTSEVHWRADCGYLLWFEEDNDSKKSHVEQQRDFLAQTCNSTVELPLRHNHYLTDVQRLLESLAEQSSVHAIERVIVDITDMPRFYTMALISQLYLSGFVSEYVFFYSEGSYVEDTRRTIERIQNWGLLPVPGAYMAVDPVKDRGFLVSVGFEPAKVSRLLARNLPDRVWLLEADPGFSDEYTLRGRVSADEVIHCLPMPSADPYVLGLTTAAAGDTAAAFDAIEQWWSGPHAGRDQTSWVALPCGPKTHLLAMTLFSLVEPDLGLACPVPAEFAVKEVVPTGKVWTHVVTDRTSRL